MGNTKFAPVLIPTLNRHLHFKRCIESLSACMHADKTELYIAFDYPLRKEHWAGYNIIKEYLPKINGFKSVQIITRKENYGPYRNFGEAQVELFKKYDRLILSEDDNYFSTDFLVFINKGLDTYEKRNDVFSVSGYQYPLTLPSSYNQSIYLWNGFSAWGVGVWKEKYEKISWERDEGISTIKQFLKDYISICKYQKLANHYIPSKLLMIEQNRIHGDGFISLYLFLNKMYSVFPVISRVRNMGHDGSGTGCGYMENDIYGQQEVYTGQVGAYMMPSDLRSNEEVYKVLSKHFKMPLLSKINAMRKILLLNYGLWP